MFALIEKQQSDRNVPVFNDPRITGIPIIDCDEQLVDISKMSEINPHIRMMTTPTIPFYHPDYSSGLPGCSLVRKGVYEKLVEMSNVIDEMAPGMNISILIHRALCDTELQKTLNETITPYATGACIDLRLYDDDREEFLDMGDFGLHWGENRTSFTFCRGLTPIQKKNRHLLLSSSCCVGLVNYPYMWWCFTYGTQYWA